MPREPRMKLECSHTESGRICSCDNLHNIHCPSCYYKSLKPKIEKLCLFNKDEYRPGHIEAIEDTVNTIIDFLDEQYEKEEKKPCIHCGTDYQDHKYCSVFGRTADEHVFDNECCGKCDDKGEPGYTECKYCPCHKEPVSERNAMIDELIQEVGIIPMVTDFKFMVYRKDVVDLLKSKKK